MTEVEQAALIQDAWRVLADLLKDGRSTLQGGKVIEPKDSDLVRHAQWLAALKPIKTRRVPRVEDWSMVKSSPNKG